MQKQNEFCSYHQIASSWKLLFSAQLQLVKPKNELQLSVTNDVL